MNTTRRLFIANFAGLCLTAWAYWEGHIQRAAEADAVHMGYVIAAVFALGVLSAFRRAIALDLVRVAPGKNARLSSIRGAHLSDIVAALFILGIMGNALGFLHAFGDLDIGSLDSPEGLRAAGAMVLAGIGTAFGSTLIGLALALWMMVNVRILDTATALLEEGA